MIIDGRSIAEDILSQTREMVGDRELRIHAVCVAPTPATLSYLRIKQKAAAKANIDFIVSNLPEDTTTEDVIACIRELPADAVIAQLPLPPHITEDTVRDAIPLPEDADVLSSIAYDVFLAQEEGARVPPVAAALAEVLVRHNVQIAGARAVVVGDGRLVGRPCAALLKMLGAEVSTVTLEQGSLDDLKSADIIVSGAGSPHLIGIEHVRPGAILIDAGTSERSGKLVGDINPEAASGALLYTPVPGGMGPIAVACLMRNVAMSSRE